MIRSCELLACSDSYGGVNARLETHKATNPKAQRSTLVMQETRVICINQQDPL